MKQLIVAACAVLFASTVHAQTTDANGNLGRIKHSNVRTQTHVMKTKQRIRFQDIEYMERDYTPFYMQVYKFMPYGD